MKGKRGGKRERERERERRAAQERRRSRRVAMARTLTEDFKQTKQTRKRGRPKKIRTAGAAEHESVNGKRVKKYPKSSDLARSRSVETTSVVKTKRGRGRPRKNHSAVSSTEPGALSGASGEIVVKRKRGRPKKSESQSKYASSSSSKALAVTERKTSVRVGGRERGRGKRRHFMEVDVNDELTLRVGDIVYVDLGTTEIDLREDGEELCEICKRGTCCDDEGNDDEKNVMIECDGCLKGYHMGCLDPPLLEIPPGEWLCPKCSDKGANLEDLESERENGGGELRLRSAREYFFAKHLGLVKIEGLYENIHESEKEMSSSDKGDNIMMSVRWFYLPEDTHTGRQPHHGAREVFRINHFDENQASCVIKTGVKVYSPQTYADAEGEGDDVFYCEYEYDPAWQRFQRWYKKENRGGEGFGLSDFDDSDDDFDWSNDHGEDDDGDEDYTVGLRRKKRGVVGSVRRRGEKGGGVGRGRGRAKMEQGGMVLSTHSKLGKNILTLGAEEVPSCLRRAAKQRSPLQKARAALTLSATPKHIPCREAEMEQIEDFVQGCISGGNSSRAKQQQGRCLYISGVPGTGKTATVLQVMRQFKKKAERQEVPPFQFVELNALRLPTPQHAYSFLLEQLTGWNTTPGRAAEELNAMYFGQESSSERKSRGGGSSSQEGRKPVTILLVDEMDQLVTRSQSVLYNIFEWPMHRDSCLSVIGIANTIDLPERFLPRVLSRLGLQRVAFQPYSQQQIQCIIRSRLQSLEGCFGENLFDKQAIEYVARKVAAVSGDVRRALELCRRGAEMACDQNSKLKDSSSDDNTALAEKSQGEDGDVKVTIKHIDGAIKEMFGASHMKLLEALPELDKIVLGFLITELKKSGTIETTLENLVTRVKRTLKMIPEKEALKDPQIAEIGSSVTQLSRMKLVVAEPPVKHRQRKIALNIPADDITYSIGSTGGENLKWMHKLLKA